MKNQILLLTIVLAISSLLLNSCSKPASSNVGNRIIPASDTNFYYLGRMDLRKPEAVRFAHTGSAIQFTFFGKSCTVLLQNISQGKDQKGNMYKNYYTILIDAEKPMVYGVGNDDKEINLKIRGEGEHSIKIFKMTEAFVGEGIFKGIKLNGQGYLLPYKPKENKRIEFIGNSITCGYGNLGGDRYCPFSAETENAYLAYGAITARNLGAEYTAVAYSGKGVYRNYDGTTEESLSLIYDRIFPDSIRSPKYNFAGKKPDAMVINLGTNDFAKGIPDSITFVNTYVNFIKRLRIYYPNTTLVCVEGPMTKNDKDPSVTKIKNYILAAKAKAEQSGLQDIHAFFFTRMLEEELGCDWHPNVAKHKAMSEELTKFFKTKLKW